jgi:bla regulator protein blaR1
MILFLIKSTLCLGILLAVYHFLLEGEKMHDFNRFYLLFSIFFAIILPFIEIRATPENLPLPEISTFNEAVQSQNLYMFTETPSAANNTFFSFLLFIIYSAIALLFLFRFVKNLLRLITKITHNSTVKYKNAKLVLLKEKVLPHTFLHYIFVSKEEYYHQQIEKELLAHELAHVEQKHTLDILFVELLKIAGWFNPLIYLFEKAIRLNHEFLADEAVIKTYNNSSSYQHILFSKICQSHASELVSSLNFSLTKKRLTMMTKKISPVQVMLKKAALIPLLLLLVVSFTTKISAQEPNQDKKPETKATTVNKNTTDTKKVFTREDSLKIINNYWQNSSMWTMRKNEDGTSTKITFKEMTDEEKLRIPLPQVPEKKPPTQEQLNAWTDPTKYGVWIDGKRIENATIKNYQPSDFGYYFISGLAKNAKNYGKHDFQVDIETLSHFEEWQEKKRKAWEIEE